MQSIYYEDLLTVPFKKGGRDFSGLDCYGLCIILCNRLGKHLPDFATFKDINPKTDKKERQEFNAYVKQISSPKKYALIEYLNEQGDIHIGFLLDEKTYIHSTLNGVRITPIFAIKNPKFYEVIK
ncbi:NlpC/P60 family protein [Treponema pectinovorum]|uniref:NlpC/P60 family protein n=1 Tax=Treponema pectinovorum TaxID=164 RepID=UPI0011C7CF70|nr:NlpC/P60 family protein [Treponema pectinovorum]